MTDPSVNGEPGAIQVEDRRFERRADWRFLGGWLVAAGIVALVFLQMRTGMFGPGARGMRTLVLICGAGIAIFIGLARRGVGRTRAMPVQLLSLAELPELVATMAGTQGEPVHTGIWFNTPGQPGPENAVHLNFSLENGRIGFDWVMAGDRNVKDLDRFLAFARGRGFEPKEMTKNGLSYFRIEEGDLVALAAGIVTKLYANPVAQPMQMVCEGFDWPP